MNSEKLFETKPRKWFGTWPSHCDICNADLEEQEYFVDGATHFGPWGLLCPKCHDEVGIGLGLGKGQKYDSQTLIKLEG